MGFSTLLVFEFTLIFFIVTLYKLVVFYGRSIISHTHITIIIISILFLFTINGICQFEYHIASSFLIFRTKYCIMFLYRLFVFTYRNFSLDD